ncbi:MAG: hemerythrin domain-containing protein [Candidatus Tectimicrobiota bacterium]
MPEVITALDYPIDVMYPIHKALRAEAAYVEEVVRGLEDGASLTQLLQDCTRWATALEYHAVMEDTYMTAPLDRPSARENEAEHKRLTELLAELQHMLQDATQLTPASARQRRHLLGKIVELRVAQDDHLEEEEERMLPFIRQHVSATRQLDMAGRLLFDQDANDSQWVLDWLMPHITALEHQLLTELTTRYAPAHS